MYARYMSHKAFPLISVSDDMHNMGRWSFWSLVWRKSVHSWRRCTRKTNFTFSFPATLSFDLQTVTCKFISQLLLSIAMFTKLEVSTAFLFRENPMHMTDGRTNGRRGATLNSASYRDGRIIKTRNFRPYGKTKSAYKLQTCLSYHHWPILLSDIDIRVYFRHLSLCVGQSVCQVLSCMRICVWIPSNNNDTITFLVLLDRTVASS